LIRKRVVQQLRALTHAHARHLLLPERHLDLESIAGARDFPRASPACTIAPALLTIIRTAIRCTAR